MPRSLSDQNASHSSPSRNRRSAARKTSAVLSFSEFKILPGSWHHRLLPLPTFQLPTFILQEGYPTKISGGTESDETGPRDHSATAEARVVPAPHLARAR
ncbi:hypothetical protein RvY_18516 [Ramazzottius varieornatus]|uniref:Uncharacterized protein n=1 Tax=Ramazzottius varieornatus TaxID=947166 RepID=A0A1D1W617_RAMVA|nr:hypothetical protein RvY_18516 [Ramazzottius varieornatus]